MTVATRIPAISAPVKYICELFREMTYDPRYAIHPNNIEPEYNITAFSIAPLVTDPSNYWIAWGGTFDNPVGYGFQLFLGEFLVEVESIATLKSTEKSFFIDSVNDILYINTPIHPWLYMQSVAALYTNEETTFSSAPKDQNNLSDIYYGNVKAYPRMGIPSFKNKLNDVISGINVYNDFQITVDNNDGLLDGLEITDFFNTPMRISKTTEDAEVISDFNEIRYGLVKDIEVDFFEARIKGVDQVYLMNRDYCRKFTTDLFPDIGDSDINNDIPVAWGSVSKVELTEINKDTADPPLWIDYIAIDPEYITACTALYDEDGNSLTFSFNSSTGIIRATQLDGDGEVIEAESVDVTGKADNKIGQIITYVLENNENIPYVSGLWDKTETDDYISFCASVDFYFDGGTTRELVEKVLKNDIAFLIQKNNGLLTLRQWGKEYFVWHVDDWLSTNEPEKNFQDASDYFCSTVEILSDKDHVDDTFRATYIDDSLENSIFEKYRRSYTARFETDLYNSSEISDLAERLLDRFGEVRETLSIGFGVDTFQVDLLDTIEFEAVINGRTFSEYSEWIVKECDPGQDEVVMEGKEIMYIMSIDSEIATIDGYTWAVSKDDYDNE